MTVGTATTSAQLTAGNSAGSDVYKRQVPESLDAKVENILDGLETEKKDSKNTDGKRVNPVSYTHLPLFAYRGIIIPLLCSYRGGS